MTDEVSNEAAEAVAAATTKRPRGRPKGYSPPRKTRTVERAAPRREETIREEQRPEPVARGLQRPKGRPIPMGLKRTARHEEDQYFIPYHLIPEGWSYEWKRKSYAGQPDTRHMNNLMENHWEAVPQDRHPQFAVENGGMILMERPAYVTHDAMRAQYEAADAAVRAVHLNINQAPENTFTRDHPSVDRIKKMSRTYSMGISVDPSESQERE